MKRKEKEYEEYDIK